MTALADQRRGSAYPVEDAAQRAQAQVHMRLGAVQARHFPAPRARLEAATGVLSPVSDAQVQATRASALSKGNFREECTSDKHWQHAHSSSLKSPVIGDHAMGAEAGNKSDVQLLAAYQALPQCHISQNPFEGAQLQHRAQPVVH